MSFDLPLTAFALESSGQAASALAGAHTLTLPAAWALEPAEAFAQAEWAAALPASGWRVGVAAQAPAALTVTL